MPSLLVTNDFPPKLGGIQSYLYELWRRLPAEETTVFTTAYAGARTWDAEQPFRVVRARQKVLLPTKSLARDVDALAREVGAQVIFLDPMLPLGLIGPQLRSAPYAVVVHGAEITVPATVPGLRALGRRVMRGAAAVVAAGGYPARQAGRIAGGDVPGVVIAPGVDGARFHPLDAAQRSAARARFGLDQHRPLILGLSRLVPRKGFDIVIDAVSGMTDVQLALAGSGRDRARLERRAHRRGAPVRFLGRVADAELPDLFACADAFAMCCRDRWGGVEAEGFGIVFLEAAACAVPSVAGRSGGAHEAVVDGETGYVVAPRDVGEVRAALDVLCHDRARRADMGSAARKRALAEYAYEGLVARLAPIAGGDFSSATPLPR